MKTIVILDDESFFLDAYRDAFQLEGFDVKIAENSETFHEFLRTSREVHAVLVDVMLRDDMDGGLRAYDQLRKDFPNLPAVLLTNRTDAQGMLEIHDNRTSVFQKFDVTPLGVVETVRKLNLPAGRPMESNG